jgi:hypothetical protein
LNVTLILSKVIVLQILFPASQTQDEYACSEQSPPPPAPFHWKLELSFLWDL